MNNAGEIGAGAKRPIVIVAGGPSLTREDVQYAEQSGADIMGINDAYRICKKLDYLYACDRRWWNWHYARVNERTACRRFSLETVGYPSVEQLENDGTEGLSFVWPRVRTGQNSGYQAINLAILLGYRRIVLLGYDMKYGDGKAHWFGDHPKPLQNPPLARIKSWISHYATMAALIPDGVRVINASGDTALTCFPQMSLKEALNGSV